jgi:tRNA(His) 5'-end guanylyltransferase
VSQLPTEETVIDYFRWRQADAARNCLNAHAYWLLRNDGASAQEADQALLHLKSSDKHELLFGRGTNFNDLPAWQRRGVGTWWVEKAREPRSSSPNAKSTTRRDLHREFELPLGEAYDVFLRERVSEATGPGLA